MADEVVSTTPAMKTGASNKSYPLGEAIAAGETAVLISGKLMKAQAVDAEANTGLSGLVLLGGATDDKGILVTGGDVDPGFVVAPGVTYYQSENGGGITQALADVSGAGVTIVGYGISAGVLEVAPKALGILGT